MKNKVIWLSLSLLMVTAMLLASCNSSTTTSTPTSTTSIVTTTSTTSTSVVGTTTSSTAQSTTTAVTTTSTGNWWDSLGTPQYGGTMTISLNKDPTDFDPYNDMMNPSIKSAWMEKLFSPDWTLDPSVCNFQGQFIPNQYQVGSLAESWEFTEPSVLVVHLRQNVYWQNIPPANGRQFVASDVVYHFGREYGVGGGFTTPSPSASGQATRNIKTCYP